LPEEVHWIADTPGELRIELTLIDGSQEESCGLRLADRRRAIAADRRRAQAEAALARGHELRRTRKPKQCRPGIAPYENAQRRFADLGLPRRRAEALLGLGRLERDCLGEKEAALRTFNRAKPLFPGNPAFESEVHQHRGELRYALGDIDGAITEYRRALELRHRIGYRAGEALSSSTLGHALHLRGRYDEAARHLDHALDLWKPDDEADKRVQTLLNRGQLHQDLGEVDQARERFQAALELFRQADDPNGEAMALNALDSSLWTRSGPMRPWSLSKAPWRFALPDLAGWPSR
jgi:tetratricopeptide (TPR) repeat protein